MESGLVPGPVPLAEVFSFGSAVAKMNLYAVVLVATLGSMAGGMIDYLVGRIIPREKLTKIPYVTSERMDTVYKIYNKYGPAVIIGVRVMPWMTYKPFLVVSGLSKMRVPVFVACVAVGSCIRYSIAILISLGILGAAGI